MLRISTSKKMTKILILWSKYPDIYLQQEESASIMGGVGFRKPMRYFEHYSNTAYMYSDENGAGAEPE